MTTPAATTAAPGQTAPGLLAIEAAGLVKTFGSTRAVDGLDLSVPRGGVFGLLGLNGAGNPYRDCGIHFGWVQSLEWQEIGLGQRCGVPLPGDCPACLPAAGLPLSVAAGRPRRCIELEVGGSGT